MENNQNITLQDINQKLDYLLSQSNRGAMGVEAAARYIDSSKDYIYQLVNRGELRCKRKGKMMLFRPEWLDEWLESKDY